MVVNNALIEKIAHLARLSFTDEEKTAVQKDLQNMVSFVEKLNEVNTEGVPPLLHIGHEINVLREDKVHGSITREEALQNAPETDGIFFKVPRVIKK